MSELKVNKISPRSGTDVTLGDSGDTFTLPTGVTLDTSNSTVTLPDSSISLAKLTATGTKDSTTFLRGDNTFAAAGGGKINQVLQTETTTPQDIASSTFTDLTSISLSITPSATSSKIFVIVNLHADTQSSDRGFGLQLVRGTTNIHTDHGIKAFYSGTSRMQAKYLHHELDSPNTTSATTYKVQIRTDGGNNVRFNDQSLSSITLMEVLA